MIPGITIITTGLTIPITTTITVRTTATVMATTVREETHLTVADAATMWSTDAGAAVLSMAPALQDALQVLWQPQVPAGLTEFQQP